jgi:cytochrome c
LVIAGCLVVGIAAGTAIGLVRFETAGETETPMTQTQALQLRPPEETFNPVFEPCAHCHQIGKGARNSTGPVLTGVIGREAASTSYPYSQAMRSSGLVWDETTLRAFIKNPHQLVPGTRMAFAGLPDEKITALIEFIRSVPANP